MYRREINAQGKGARTVNYFSISLEEVLSTPGNITLTHFRLMFYFYSPWKHRGFLIFLGCKKWLLALNGFIVSTTNVESFLLFLESFPGKYSVDPELLKLIS